MLEGLELGLGLGAGAAEVEIASRNPMAKTEAKFFRKTILLRKNDSG